MQRVLITAGASGIGRAMAAGFAAAGAQVWIADRDGGALVLTSHARHRLEELDARIAAEQERAANDLEEAEADRTFFREELDKTEQGKNVLARRWVWAVVTDWLRDNGERLHEELGELRRRHERLWFYRAQVNRMVLLASNGANREALTAACRKLYPGLDAEQSHMVPFAYEPADVLPDREREAVEALARKERLTAEQMHARLDAALAEHNEALLTDYLGVVTTQLTEARPDLLMIEHAPEIAIRILEHLHRELPPLKGTPTILVMSDYWAPPAEQALPWPRTRVVLLRRMGALSGADCLEHLRALYAA